MFYNLRRNLRYFHFHRQIGRLLDTPPIAIRDAPLTVVSLVAGYDVKLYLLGIKSLYRRLQRGKILVIADGISPASRELIRRHIPLVEFEDIENIHTGPIQKGGTWERLVYCIERSAQDYVIQMDSDVLCVGPIPEVLESVAGNRAFALADGIPKKPLAHWVEDAIARNSDNIVIEFEKRGPEFPNSENVLYLRGSSGFAGFAQGAITRDFLEDFHAKGMALLGPRWREWGTEQIASNFAIANSPDSVPLPKPKYLTWERQAIPADISLLHFLGYCRFDQGIYSTFANREIDALLQ